MTVINLRFFATLRMTVINLRFFVTLRMTKEYQKNKPTKSQAKLKNKKIQFKTEKTHQKGYRIVWILSNFVTNLEVCRNLNCKGRSLSIKYWNMLADAQIHYPCLVRMGDHRHARYSRILDDLDNSEATFYLLFPLIRAKLVYCVETQKPNPVW